LPSRRYRSRTSLGTRINRIRYSVSKSENTSIPSVVGDNSVSGNALARNAVSTDYIAGGAVDATVYGAVPYIPSGEGNQRVPAPLSEPLYWTKVVEGRVELHRSGIHGDGEIEDTQHVTAETDGLRFDATTGETARIYLTGRLDLPKSRKVYGTWKSDLPIDIKLIYWINSPTYFVESAYRQDGITHIDVSNTSHTMAVGDSIRVYDTTDDFNGLYKVVEAQTDYVKATDYESAYTLTVNDSAYVNSTDILTLTITGIDPDNTVVRAADLVVLKSLAGYEGFGGYYQILTADDTTTANTLVITVSVNSDADVADFYNGQTLSIYTFPGVDSVSYQYFSPFGKVSEEEYHYVELEDRTVWGADGYTLPISEVSLTSNVARVVTNFANYLQVGDEVTISGVDELLAVPPATPVFDATHTVTASNNSSRSFNFSVTASNVTAQTNLYNSVVVTRNQYTPQQYAVYAEVPASENSIKTLNEAKVFEVVGEPSTQPKYFTVTNVALTNNLATLTLSENAPTDGAITVNLTDDTLSATFDGTFVIGNVSANTISYAVTKANVASQAATGTLLADVGVRHSELSPSGLVFYGPDGAVESRLGSAGLDKLSLANAYIDVEGTGTFNNVVSTGLSVSENASFGSSIAVDGDMSLHSTVQDTPFNLYGAYDAAKYHVVSNAATNSPYTQTNSFASYTGDILNRFPRGIIYSVDYGDLLTDTTNTATADRYTWAAGSFTLEPFRNYLFVVSFGAAGISTASNQASRVEFIASSNISTTGNYALNTMVTANAVHVKQAHHFPANYVGPFPPMVFQYTTTNTAVSNGISRSLIQGGAEIFWQLRFTYANTATRTNAVITIHDDNFQDRYGISIYDMGGFLNSSTGYSTFGESKWLNTGNVVAGGAIGSTTTTITGSATSSATSSAYYDNYGKGDSGTSDPYANERSLYQGNPGTASGTKKSQVVFRAISEIVGANISGNVAPYSNFTVTNIEVYLRNRHSYLGGGLTTSIGTTTANSLGSSSPQSGTGNRVTTSFTKGQGKWVTLSSAQRSGIVADTGGWGILISQTSGTSTYDSTLNNYGYFDGALLSDPPKVRVSYTYQETVS